MLIEGDEEYLTKFLNTLYYDQKYAATKFSCNRTWHSIIVQLVIYGFHCQGGCMDGDSKEFAEFMDGNGYTVTYSADKNWMYITMIGQEIEWR